MSLKVQQASREELLIFGYIKEFHKKHNIHLPPNDLMVLFVAWLKLLDSFDMNKSPSDIRFDPVIPTKFKREDTAYIFSYSGVAGTIIVEQGMKQSWSFKIDKDAKYLQIGIMFDGMIELIGVIKDNFDSRHRGYGLRVPHWAVYHSNRMNGGLGMYANQFETTQDFVFLTMELDMTQAKGDQGILKYIIHNEPKSDVKEIRTDGEYSSIAYDSLDINAKYRMTVSFDGQCCTKWIELVNV